MLKAVQWYPRLCLQYAKTMDKFKPIILIAEDKFSPIVDKALADLAKRGIVPTVVTPDEVKGMNINDLRKPEPIVFKARPIIEERHGNNVRKSGKQLRRERRKGKR